MNEKHLYRHLHPTKEGKRTYRYITTKEITVRLHGLLATHPEVAFQDAKGKTWAWIVCGKITIAKGYAWNGCSPKTYIGFPPVGAWIGTPDFDATIIPSLIHDVLFQFAEVGKHTLHNTNLQFLRMMEERHFRLAAQYFEAVEIFGGKFWGKDKSGVKATYL
jgi:hypothetical protein